MNPWTLLAGQMAWVERLEAEADHLNRLVIKARTERDAALAANAELRAALECAISEHEARVGECCCAICDTAKAALSRPDLEAGVVVVPREVVERVRQIIKDDDCEDDAGVLADLGALLKKGGG